MWRSLAKICAWMYVQGAKTKAGRNKRKVEIDATLSEAWDSTSKGWGNREFFTVGLSQFFYERGDFATIDELVDYIHDEHVYLIRKRPEEGATPRRRKRT